MNSRLLLLTLTIGSSLLSSLSALAQETNANSAADKSTPLKLQAAKTIDSAPARSNPVTQAAVRAGVLSCASRIDQTANFLSGNNQPNSQSSAFLFTPSSQQDQQVFSMSMEITSPNTPLTYASASFAPNQANGCGAVYETVVFWPASCEDVASQKYPGIKPTERLGQQTAVLILGPSARVFLMPATSRGCVAIKKEIIR